QKVVTPLSSPDGDDDDDKTRPVMVAWLKACRRSPSMRAAVSFVLICLGIAALPIQAQQNGQKSGKPLYQIQFDAGHDMDIYQDPKTNKVLIKVSFVVSTQETGVEELGADYRLRIVEDGKPVMDVDLPRAHRTEELDVMLALDTSGSMKEHGRIAQARV